jgi:hypothetical protein
MAKRTLLDAAQKTVVKAAKVGAEGVKDVATDALGAAASAAAGVVLGRVSDVLGSGQKKADEAAPRVSQAVSTNTTPSRRKPIKKGSRNSERAAAPRRAKKQNTTKKRSESKPSRTKTATATRAKPRKGGTKKKAARGRS